MDMAEFSCFGVRIGKVGLKLGCGFGDILPITNKGRPFQFFFKKMSCLTRIFRPSWYVA
jgi:hypothetical protein